MIHIVIKETGATPRGLGRVLPGIKRESFQTIGEMWHRKFRPRHFTKAGARRYGYKPRRGERMSRGSREFWRSYTGRKLAMKGHTLPLVFSGLTRQLTRMRQIRATSKGVRVVLRAPGLNRRNPRSKINMREEMTRVALDEVHELTERFDARLQKGLDTARYRRTVKLA